MAIFHPGQRIFCRGEEWQIIEANERKVVSGDAVWEIYARGTSGISRGLDYCFMSDIEDDLTVVDPSQVTLTVDSSRAANRSRVYLEAHLRRLMPRNGAIYIGQHGAFNAFDYQLDPAAKALHMIRPRILIGDAVGLGKTIECGILLSELIRRGKAQRILVAVPKALLTQFQNEMWGRFSIPFHRLDSKGLERIRQDLPSTMNPFYHFNRALISVDTLKMKRYQKLLQDCSWDVLVIDEAHNVSDRTDGGAGSQRYRVAKKLAERSRAVVLMSATPHDGTKQGFASLIKLLDRTAVPSDENYRKEDIEKHFIRRTRASIKDAANLNLQKRKSFTKKISLAAGEVNVLQAIHVCDFKSNGLSKRQVGAKELFKTTLVKSFLSSPHALQETLNKKLARLEADTKNSKKTPGADGWEDIQQLRNIQSTLEGSGALENFSRIKELVQFLKENPPTNEDRVVIFTERLRTMKLIAQSLLDAGIVNGVYDPKASGKSAKNACLVATAHGEASLTDIDLNATVQAFQERARPVHVLVATNIASEGLNLHNNCHRLVHFDLPWSLITLEQRNGRIDRLNQRHPPEIYYFASVATEKTRESSLQDLRDDFWIIEKVEKRMERAGEDMDEEALRRGFSSAAEEEASETDRYESLKTSEPPPPSVEDLMGFLMNEPTQLSEADRAYRGRLPTLYSSPSDFAKQVAISTRLTVDPDSGQALKLELNRQLRQETEKWPSEFRPSSEAKHLKLEPEAQVMAEHYELRRNAGYALEKSFMNEIHPALQMLENAAFGLFPGQQVPVIAVPGGTPGSVYFAMHGGLFNHLNESAFQTWELIEFEKGKSTPEKFVDLYEPKHTQEVVNSICEFLDNASERASLDEFTLRRAQNLVASAVKWMTDQIVAARKTRAESLKPVLNEENKRITKWERERRDYLESIIQGNAVSIVHGGIAGLKKRAEEELALLGDDKKKYDQFIKDTMATSAQPDVRVLAVFVGA